MKINKEDFEEFLQELKVYLNPHANKLDKEEWLELGSTLERRVDKYQKQFQEPESRWKQLKMEL